MPNFYKLAAILGSPNLLHLRDESRRERMTLRFYTAVALLRTRACFANPFLRGNRKHSHLSSFGLQTPCRGASFASAEQIWWPV